MDADRLRKEFGEAFKESYGYELNECMAIEKALWAFSLGLSKAAEVAECFGGSIQTDIVVDNIAQQLRTLAEEVRK